MKIFGLSICVVLSVAALSHGVFAGITFGSDTAGFKVSAGTLSFGTNASLNRGSLINNGGTLSASTTLNCVNVTIEQESGTTHKSMTVNGGVVLTGAPAITLVNNQKLCVDAGLVSQAVTASGDVATPSLLQGYGQFASAIQVADGKQLNMRWNNALNVAIQCGADAYVKLEQDLFFAPGVSIVCTDEANTAHVNFNGYRLFMGGDESSATTINNPQVWTNANIMLNGPLAFNAAVVSQATLGGYLNGNGNAITFSPTAGIDNGGYAMTVVDVVLEGVTASTLTGAGTWNFLNTRFESDDNSFVLNGAITSDTVDIFNGVTIFNDARIDLHKNILFSADWYMTGECRINATGGVLSFDEGTVVLSADSSLSLTDITLANVVASSFNTLGAQSLALSHVNWLSESNGSLRINPMPGNDDGAIVTLSTHAAAGNIFARSTTWSHAVIELLNDAVLETTWVFNTDVVLDGGGRRLNLANGGLQVANGCTLYLRNIILDDVATASLISVDTGTVDLSQVTIMLGAADVEWGNFYTNIVVNGPLYVVTGQYRLVMPSAQGTTVLNDVTVYYDTLSTTDSANLIGCTGSGRVLFVSAPIYGDIIYDGGSGGTSYVYENTSLGSGENGLALDFSGIVTYDGGGYIVTFPGETDAILTVNAAAGVTTKNVLFNRLVPSHLDVHATATLAFCDQTTIRLMQDWAGDVALTTTLTFGAGSGDAQSMVLDLNGFMIDMSHADAALGLDGPTGSTLRICNGRILNVSSSKLSASAGNKIIFENVEIGLSGHYDYSEGALRIEGDCLLSGTSDAQFQYNSTDDFTIAQHSRLTIGSGLIYYHNNEAINNFVFEDETSQLVLIGGTFKRANTENTDKLVLKKGWLIVDHVSVINVGSRGIACGDGTHELNIEFRPGGRLRVDGLGSLVYHQNT